MQPRCASVAGGQLRAQVTLPFGGRADIVEQQGKNVAIDFTGTRNLHRRNAKAFLINLAARAHGAGVHATDIGVMRARSNEEIGSAMRWNLCAAPAR